VAWLGQYCLALGWERLRDHGAAERALQDLRADIGDAGAYQYAEIHAQWGDTARALDWLETSYRYRNPGLASMRGDPALDLLRSQPRYRVVERQRHFPS
jgi:hypothetical protein